jgi:hypothetical protein
VTLTLRRLVRTSFVTSQGSAYGRFRRALDSGNATIALAAAADLEHVGLADAFELLLLLMLDAEPVQVRACVAALARTLLP